MWSFVGKKSLKQWMSVSNGRGKQNGILRGQVSSFKDASEIVGLDVGSRSPKAAKGLLLSLPPARQQCAIAYTDLGQA